MSKRATAQHFEYDAQFDASLGFPDAAAVEIIRDQDGNLLSMRIYHSADPSTNFTAAPIGAELTNTTDGGKFVKIDAVDDWDEVTVS
jgi:hypothetical protein